VYCFGSRRSDCATAWLIESVAARAQCMELLLGATALELNSGGASARRIGVSMFRWLKTEYAARHAIGVIGQMNHQVEAGSLCGGQLLAGLQHCGQLAGRYRLAEVVTLNLVAAVQPQKLVLLGRFDPFGEHSHSQAVRQ